MEKTYREIELLEKARTLGYEYVEYWEDGDLLMISDLVNNDCTNNHQYILYKNGEAKRLDENGYLVYPNQTEIKFYWGELDQIIQQMIKDIKEEMAGKEFTVLEMENNVNRILEAHGNEVTENTIFDGPTKDWIREGGFAYRIFISEFEDNSTHHINVLFDVTKDNEDLNEIIVKVTEAEYV